MVLQYIFTEVFQVKFNNAREEYAQSVTSINDVLAITEETVFGSGKRGFLFTYDGHYYDGCKGMNSYATEFNSLSSWYHLHSFNQMLSNLHEASHFFFKAKYNFLKKSVFLYTYSDTIVL